MMKNPPRAHEKTLAIKSSGLLSHHEMVSPQRLKENERKYTDSTGLEECRAGHYISGRPLNGQESFLDRGWV